MIDDRAEEALRLAEAALAHAQREGATEAEALVMADDAALTRFANSQIHQNVAETNAVVNLRFVVGKRVGVASSGRTDDEGLRRLAERAASIARVVEELDDWGGLPGPSEAADIDAGYSAATADASPESRADGRPPGHRRRRRGRGDGLRLVLDRHRDGGHRQQPRRPPARDADRLASS